MEMLSKRLNLTDDQKAKIQPILDEGTPKIKAIHEEAMKQIKAVMEGIHEKIKPILTPEQQQKLEDLKKEMENRPHWGPGANGPHGNAGGGENKQQDAATGPGKQGMRGGGFGERLTKELNLTPEQQAQVKPIMEDTRSKMKALHEDTTLTPEQRRAKAKEVREANRAKIKALLTPEQQQKMEQLKKEHGEHGEQGDHGPEGAGHDQPE